MFQLLGNIIIIVIVVVVVVVVVVIRTTIIVIVIVRIFYLFGKHMIVKKHSDLVNVNISYC